MILGDIMSRMDRYYNNSVVTKRTSRNRELYKTIYEDSEYSNIEGIATIENPGEIDITKIKNMLKNRNDFSSNREFKSYVPKEVPKYDTSLQDEDRVYDIRDILNKAKSNKATDKYHNLDQQNIEILRELKQKSRNIRPTDDLDEMIDTITNTSKLNKLSDHELGLDMFEDLKSNDNTIIDGKDSIRTILEEAKRQELQKQEKTETNLDRSFYTSGLSFNEEDFEQMEELKKSVKKTNTLLRILLFIIILVVAIGIVMLIFNLLK